MKEKPVEELNEKTQELLEKWESNKSSYTEITEANMLFDYTDYTQDAVKVEKSLIAEALAFWRFIKKNFDFDEVISWEIRREFLSEFIDHKNMYLMAVAYLESLPTSELRKLLWKKNIDFVSFESFLRRLTFKQMQSISKTYWEIFKDGDSSKIWKESWTGKKTTIGNLLKEPINHHHRYERKAAWSYNLLSLNFGFNSYPNGSNDDYKLVEVSPLRFLSKKNHVDDFVVDQESTDKVTYWKMYRSARLRWWLGGDVQLNTHICPGFWYTMIIHFLFWIISPLCLGAEFLMATSSINFHPLFYVAVGIPSAIMPLWILIVSMRYLFLLLLPEQRRDSIADWVDDKGEVVSDLIDGNEKTRWLRRNLGDLFLSSAFGFIILFLSHILFEQLIKGLHIFDAALIVLLPLVYIFYVGGKAIIKKENVVRLIHQPKFLQVFYVSGLSYLLVKMCVVKLDTIMYVLAYLWDLINKFGIIGILFLVPIPGIIIFEIMNRWMSEETFEKIYRFFMHGFVGLFLILAVSTFIYTIFVFDPIMGYEQLIFCGISIFSAMIVCLMAYWADPESMKIESKLFASKKVITKRRGFRSYLNNNKTFCQLEKEDQDRMLARAHRVVYDLFSETYRRVEAYKKLLPVMDDEILARLEKSMQDFDYYTCDSEDEIRIVTFYLVIEGHTVKEGKYEAYNLRYIRERRNKEIRKTLKYVFFFIYYPVVFFGGLINWLWDKVTTLKRIWVLFNKLCPFNMEKGTLEMH